MTLSLDDLITVATQDEVKAKLYALADDLGLKTTAWQRLSPLRTIFAILARLLSGYTEVQATLAKSGFLDTASGKWLTRVAHYVYGVDRNEATAATGTVTVDNTGGGSYSFAPGDLVFLNSTTGKTYANVAAVTITPLETGVEVEVEALEVGSASTAAPGQIDDFSSALPALTCTNDDALVGEDEEEDPDLRVRCRLSLAALSPNGAADAYRYVALTQTLNGGVDVTRVQVLPPPGDGTVTIVIAGPDGALSPTEVTTVDGKIQGTVVREVDTAYVVSATNATIDQTIDVYISTAAGMLDPAVEALAATALATFYAKIPIGGVPLQGGPTKGVAWRAMEGAIEAANEFIFEAKLSSEVDVPLDEDEVPVVGTTTVVVHQVAA